MTRKKLYTLGDIMPEGMPTIKRRPVKKAQRKVNRDLLARCNQAWENLRPIRETGERIMNYCYGDQWGDIIEYKNGYISERRYLQEHSTVPLVNNIMASILNSIVGLYSKQGVEPVCFARTHDSQWLSDMMSATMQCNWQETRMQDVLKHCFEDYCVRGVAMTRETYDEKERLFDAWTDAINSYYAFWEANYDVRFTDLTLIGTLNDVSPEELYKQFAREEFGLTKQDLQEIYHLGTRYDGTDDYDDISLSLDQNEQHKLENVSFFNAANTRMCRVIEVWSQESKERYQCFDPLAINMEEKYFRCEKEDIGDIRRINIERKKLYDESGVPKEDRPYITAELIQDTYWKYTYMAPDGTVLCEGESPYDHHSHPFTLKLYPYINGEIHPYMGNIVDQQRYINRLIIMHDMAARSAAKGVTIVPISCIPDGMTPKDFAEEFTAYDGLVFYQPSRQNPNLRPEIITSNAVQIGTPELLNIQMQLIRDISNVSGALQGKTPSAGTSAARYSQETQNATTSLYGLLFDFSNFTEQIADKKCEVIKQFYDDGRLIFNKDFTDMMQYDRLSAQDVKFKISIKESAATAAYQSQVNDALMQLLQMQVVSPRQFLQNCNLPFADKLLQQIESEEAQQAALQQMMAEQQQLAAQGQQADQQAVQQAQQYLHNPNVAPS